MGIGGKRPPAGTTDGAGATDGEVDAADRRGCATAAATAHTAAVSGAGSSSPPSRSIPPSPAVRRPPEISVDALAAACVAAASPLPPAAKRSPRAPQRRLLRPCALELPAAYAAVTAPPPPPLPPATTPERSASPQLAACVPRDGVRVTGARGGSPIVETSVTVDSGTEAAAAFASSLIDPANPVVDEFSFGACAVSGVRIEESAAAAAPAEAAPAKPPPAPPPSPAMTDNGPLRTTVGVAFHEYDDNQHPEEEIEGCDGGLWDYAIQPWHRLPRREKSPSPPAPDDASATGRTYDDITKPPPPHLRCVVSPLSSLPPVPRCTAASLPRWFTPRCRG